MRRQVVDIPTQVVEDQRGEAADDIFWTNRARNRKEQCKETTHRQPRSMLMGRGFPRRAKMATGIRWGHHQHHHHHITVFLIFHYFGSEQQLPFFVFRNSDQNLPTDLPTEK